MGARDFVVEERTRISMQTSKQQHEHEEATMLMIADARDGMLDKPVERLMPKQRLRGRAPIIIRYFVVPRARSSRLR